MTRRQLRETHDQASAWARGQHRRRRRQALTGAAIVVGAVGALAVAVAVLAGGTDGALDQVPAGTPTPTATPTTEAPDGANAGGVSVQTLAGQAGELGSVDGRGPAARLSEIKGIAVAPSGTVYISEAAAVRKITPDGVVTTLTAREGPLRPMQDMSDGFHDLVVGPDETVYVVDGTAILSITPDGTISKVATTDAPGQSNESGPTSPTGSGLSSIRGITVDAAGTLYVADEGWVRTITPDGQVKTVGSCAHGPDAAMCEQLAVDANGTIRFLNHFGRFPFVGTMTPDGQVSNLAVDGAGKQVRFGTRHYGFALDPTDSSVYISHSPKDGGHALHKVARDGTVTTIDHSSAQEGDHGTLVDDHGTPLISPEKWVGPLTIGADGTTYASVPGAILAIQGL